MKEKVENIQTPKKPTGVKKMMNIEEKNGVVSMNSNSQPTAADTLKMAYDKAQAALSVFYTLTLDKDNPVRKAETEKIFEDARKKKEGK